MDERIRRIVDGPLYAAIEPAAALEVRKGVAYTATDDGGPVLDLYLPRAAAAAPRPAWLLVHGGPLPAAMTAKRPPGSWRFFRDYGALAAAAGRVGIVVGHRYDSIETIPGSEADVRAAVEWVRAQAGELGVDPERLGLWLFSGAGVHLAPLLAAPPPGVRTVVAFYPVVEPEVLTAMGLGPVPERLRDRSPAAVADPRAAPRLFLVRAGRDQPALNAALDGFAARLAAAGATVELATHPSGQHGFEILDDDARTRELVERAAAFLVRGESVTEPLPRVVRPAVD